MKKQRLLYTGIGLLSAATVGLLFAVVMEIITQEPVYMIVMKVAAGFFGISGPLLGWAIARRNKDGE